MLYDRDMNNWYILPNGNIKHVNGLELQPEKDWFPTTESMERYAEERRQEGMPEALIIKAMMDLAVECEAWARDNLT